jgi:predicted RNA-binding Zn ribbon-like protein
MHGTLENLSRRGNAPCLDFVNTVQPRTELQPRDYLLTYDDLAGWARAGGLLSDFDHRRLTGVAGSHGDSASGAMELAVDLRELLYRVFLAIVRGVEPSGDDLAAVNGWLAVVLGHRRIVTSRGRYRWSWERDDAALDRPLWPVVLSACELLVGADRRRIKECPAPDGCGWLFLDTSKNAARRWCDMRTCGNIAKARRHYRRHRRRREPDS